MQNTTDLELCTNPLSAADDFELVCRKIQKSLYIKDKFNNRVGNILAKGEIALKSRFLSLPQYFQKSSAAEASVCGKGNEHKESEVFCCP